MLNLLNKYLEKKRLSYSEQLENNTEIIQQYILNVFKIVEGSL